MKVRLFFDVTAGSDTNTRNKATSELEAAMNDFLKDLDDVNVQKIYVAIGACERMGLIQYKEAYKPQ